MELSSTTLSIGTSRLTLRQDLKFHHRGSGERAYYVIEDQVTGKFFQIGKLEYSFLSMLDGNRTISQVIEKLATVQPNSPLDQFLAAKICKWAIESRIVKRDFTLDERQELETTELIRGAKTWLNPVTLKIPVCRPDAVVGRLSKMLGWCFQAPGLALWLAFCLFGLFQFLPHLDQFVSQRTTVFSSDDIFWFAAAWVGLKLIHELAHAIACKSFGCSVRSCGMILLLLIPLPYVDVTDSWKLHSKWKRIVVAAAGMIAEFFVAAMACLVWVGCEPGVLQTHAGNLIIAATIHTILFNANPLMRFDGYYILSDWLEIPNLATLGRAHARSVMSRLFFGTARPHLEESGWRLSFIKVYGWLATFWSLTISIGIVLAAYSMFAGVGVLLAGVACLFWYGFPLFSLCKYLVQGNDQGSPNRLRFAFVSLLCVALLGTFLTYCPGPSAVSAPLVVKYEPLHVVRAKTMGMIKEIHVANGQTVKEGELLLTLENHQLISEIESLKIDIEIANDNINSLISRGQVAKVRLKEETLRSVKDRLIELEKSAKQLEVRAVADGQVLSRNLLELAGTYLHPGDSVLEIGAPSRVHAIAMLNQNDVSWLQHENENCKVAIDGRLSFELLDVQIESVSPRATQEISHAAFDASQGGSLPVVTRGHVTNASVATESQMIHSQPWFEVAVQMELADRKSLRAGQTGTLYVYSRQQCIGRYLIDQLWRVTASLRTTSHGI